MTIPAAISTRENMRSTTPLLSFLSSLVPRRLPKIEPRRHTAINLKSKTLFEKYTTLEHRHIKKIQVRVVAWETFVESRQTNLQRGTSISPPPAPKKPFTAPAIIPIAKTFNSSRILLPFFDFFVIIFPSPRNLPYKLEILLKTTSYF